VLQTAPRELAICQSRCNGERWRPARSAYRACSTTTKPGGSTSWAVS